MFSQMVLANGYLKPETAAILSPLNFLNYEQAEKAAP